jgi:Holliday junction resolvasome RuvABC ATP-dependent DNA helicase subunit
VRAADPKTVTNDAQTLTILNQFVTNPLCHFLMQGVPGLGKTTIAALIHIMYDLSG